MISQPYVGHKDRMGREILHWSAGGEKPRMLSCGKAQSGAFKHTGGMRNAVVFNCQEAKTQNEMTKAWEITGVGVALSGSDHFSYRTLKLLHLLSYACL